MDSKIYPATFIEAYEKYKDLIDKVVPHDTIQRLLKAEGYQVCGDAWEGTDDDFKLLCLQQEYNETLLNLTVIENRLQDQTLQNQKESLLQMLIKTGEKSENLLNEIKRLSKSITQEEIKNGFKGVSFNEQNTKR